MRTHLLLSLSLLGLTLACREDAESPTAPDPSPALATTASALVFAQLSAGNAHTCGVTSDNRLYCWGANLDGELGDGTTTKRLVPVPVGGTLRFRQVSAGGQNTCGVTTDNRAYCWGFNLLGTVGDGTTTGPRLTPVPVTGGHLFRRVEVGRYHVCAVTSSGDRAFCWGDNRSGQLGIGNNTGPETISSGGFSSKPVAVSGTLTFRHVAAGAAHTCGVTTDNRVFCWGSNRYGAVGDSSTALLRLRPVRVAGTRQYRQVDAGPEYTCAVTLGSRAFCWGQGLYGRLGNGEAPKNSRYPRPVSGGLSFDRVSTGDVHACAETTGNRAYCWGNNSGGELGDGTTTDRLTPRAVVGGLFFSQVSAGGEHTCGRTSVGRAYCWGYGGTGALGTGTTDIVNPTPVPVAGPM
jgi:alpha-tubulin suppressor-like RCC1 family protein